MNDQSNPVTPTPRTSRERRTFLLILLVFTAALLITLAVILFKASTTPPAIAPDGPGESAPFSDESSQTAPLPPAHPAPEEADVIRNDQAPAPADDGARRLDAWACPYDFSATVKTVSGSVYRLSRLQTLSRFPFPPDVKEPFGRLMVMAWAPTNGAVPSAPFVHFWFSRVRRLHQVGAHLEITTASGQHFRSEWGWLSNSRHKRYAYENRDGHHEIIVGLRGDQQVCLDSVDLDEIDFTTDESEIRRFEHDVANVLPARQPAVFQFENRRVTADRFFLLDAAGEWYRTIFFHPWWPGGLEFTIWHDAGRASENFWDLPQVPISKADAKHIQFGPAPDWIRTRAQLRDRTELTGYLVTHTESQRGAWQWNQGRDGFWDSIVLFTEDGLDVFAMFPGGPHFAELAAEVGALMSVTFEDSLPGDTTR